jgi:hypothetical protein
METKTQNHYIQCQAPSRIQWRIQLLASVRQVMERLNTDSNLQETILNCIDSAITERAVISNGPFSNALESQSDIGWIDMLRGYWSNKWQVAYEQSYSVPNNEDRKAKNKQKLQMQRWQKKIIQTIWNSMIKLWKLWNDERHGWDAESRESACGEVLHSKLAEIYNRKNEYPRRVQRLLRTSYNIHIQEKQRKLQTGLRTRELLPSPGPRIDPLTYRLHLTGAARCRRGGSSNPF